LYPSQNNKRLVKALKIDQDQETGFFLEADPLNKPLESTQPGIYLCGGALGPTDISEAVTQATAACMRAISDQDHRTADDSDMVAKKISPKENGAIQNVQ
jgi:heterodisulfide reductase subunit A